MPDDVARVAVGLNAEQRYALMSSTPHKQSLISIGLAHWGRRPGHRHLSVKLNERGFAAKAYLKATQHDQP